MKGYRTLESRGRSATPRQRSVRKKGYHLNIDLPQIPNLNKNGHFPPHPGVEDQLRRGPLPDLSVFSPPHASSDDDKVLFDGFRVEGARKMYGERGTDGEGQGVWVGGEHFSEATTRSGVAPWGGAVSTTTTKSPPTQEMHLPSHTNFVWRPAFYALFPYKKSPFRGTNLDLNIFSRNSRPNEPGGYVWGEQKHSG